MIDPAFVEPNEQETVRVFVLDLPLDEAEAIAKKTTPNGAPPPLARMLGLDALDFAHVETFAAQDLKGLGLSGYITEGLGVDESAVDPDAPVLDGQKGRIVILHAKAFMGGAAVLQPTAPLRHLASYRLAEAAPAQITPPAPASPAPADSGGTPTEQGPPARLPRSLVLIALLVAAALALGGAFLLGGGA